MDAPTPPRFTYGRNEAGDLETEVATTIKQTLNQGINDGGTLCFRIPADHTRFTDLNSVLLKLVVSVTKPDGSAIDEEATVWLDLNGMHSLFASVETSFNDTVVSRMSYYPYTTALSRFLGCAKDIRTGCWDSLDGTQESDLLKSNAVKLTPSDDEDKVAKLIKEKGVLIGRVYSDVLTTARQYLPPGVTLGINMRRAVDNFSLVTNVEGQNYRLGIDSASLYVRRIQIRESLLQPALDSAKTGVLNFNRLECRVISLPAETKVYRWLDALQASKLPNRVYLAFVSQKSLYGHINQVSTYMENANLTQLNFKLDGRDLLVEPIRTSFVNVNGNDGEPSQVNPLESDGRMGFLTLLEALNQVSDQTSTLKAAYYSFLLGCTYYAVELSKCGAKANVTGSLDVEMEFSPKVGQESAVLLFSERSDAYRFT